MINMVALVEYCAHTQQGKKEVRLKLFCNHDSFSDKISLYDLCMKSSYHREIIHNICKNDFTDTNITMSTLRDMFEYFRQVISIQSEDHAFIS